MKSTDGGSVWTVSDTLYDSYGDVTADQNDDVVFWTGGNNWNGSQYVPVVSKTDDVGETWARFQLSDSSGMVNCVTVHPSNSDILFTGGFAGSFPFLYKTEDGGVTWTDATSGITSVVNDIVIDPDSNGTMYAGTDAGVFKSIDGAVSWSHTGLAYVNDLLIDPLTPTTVIAATNAGVYVSTNSCGDWQPLNGGLDTAVVTCLGIHPNVYLYAGTYGSGLYRMEWVLGTEEYVDGNADQNVLGAHPNPAGKNVTLSYTVSQSGHVRITVYDVQGRLVLQLLNGQQHAGAYQIIWDCHDEKNRRLRSGIYFVHLSGANDRSVVKFVILN